MINEEVPLSHGLVLVWCDGSGVSGASLLILNFLLFLSLLCKTPKYQASFSKKHHELSHNYNLRIRKCIRFDSQAARATIQHTAYSIERGSFTGRPRGEIFDCWWCPAWSCPALPCLLLVGVMSVCQSVSQSMSAQSVYSVRSSVCLLCPFCHAMSLVCLPCLVGLVWCVKEIFMGFRIWQSYNSSISVMNGLI